MGHVHGETMPGCVGVGGQPVAVGMGAKLADNSLPIIEYVPTAVEEAVAAVLEHLAVLTPTQYEKPASKPIVQSSLTEGFHVKNSAGVIPYFPSITKHESPDTTS